MRQEWRGGKVTIGRGVKEETVKEEQERDGGRKTKKGSRVGE